MPERPEDKVIIYATRREVDDDTKRKIKKLTTDLDWDYLIVSACRNRIFPLLYHQIKNICPENIPKNYLRMFDEEFDWRVKLNLLLTSELIKILKLFESNINSIPLNGPALTYQVYKNLALRNNDKIDIIIDKKDIQKAKECLLFQGYKLKFEPESNKESSFIKSVSEYIFIDDRELIQVNIKWNYLKDTFYTPIDIRNILVHKRMETINFYGSKLINPSFENLLLILCINCAKRQWTRLSYICDIAELVRNNDLDWKKIFMTMKKFRLERILFINLFIIRELLSVKLPDHVNHLLNEDRSVKPISTKIVKRLFSHTDKIVKMRRKNCVDLKLYFQIRENKYDGIKDVLNNLGTSKPYEINSPSTSLNLITQYISKPFRLFKEVFFDEYPVITLPEPYVLTPKNIIIKMLKLAKIGPNDVIYDLGCGDGRIIITAAEKFGTKGVGIDLDHERVKEAQYNAKKKGVEHLTTFLHQDIMKSNISNATIITMYHVPSINLMIRPKLRKELNSDTRIVTREFSMGEWDPIKTELVVHEGLITPIYLYKV